ncbi:MAG: DUF1015 domain-containing protein [Chloroflexi bacterium]|nr:DUF1015 domain-containing protein [Chloroflexota bacterium]
MAEIRPFRGIHYNSALIKDLSTVICPPYDIISSQLQQELYLKSEYNFVRVEFARELPQDCATDNRYTRSAATLEQWLKRGILVVDETPAIYLTDQHFTYAGKEYKRRGITVRIKLEEWDKMVIRPHEGTMSEPKSDRLSLLWALQANTSSIFALFEDKRRQIASVLSSQEQRRPLLEVKKTNGDGHTVWAITEPEAIKQISGILAQQPLYIADGHHRYESALAYRREKLDYSKSASGEEAFNFVMMTLVDFTNPGLLILPPHRLVRGISQPALDGIMDKLSIFFDIENLGENAPPVCQKIDSLFTEAKDSPLILFGPEKRFYALRLRDPASVAQMMPYFHSDLYKKLDVSIIDHVILENLLRLSTDKEKASLAYVYDRMEVVNRVLNQEYQLAFILKPIKADIIKAIADISDKMPRKSTYFYPKLPAGLLVNRLV